MRDSPQHAVPKSIPTLLHAALGLVSGLVVMWSYETAFSTYYDEDFRLLLWVRVPTFTAAVGLFASLAIGNAIRRWVRNQRRWWVLLLWAVVSCAVVAAAFVSIGGHYFGNMRLPYIGPLRLVCAIVIPVFVFAVSVARYCGASTGVAILSTIVFFGVFPAATVWQLFDYFELSSIRRLAFSYGEHMTLIAIGAAIGGLYGLAMSCHLVLCAKFAVRKSGYGQSD